MVLVLNRNPTSAGELLGQGISKGASEGVKQGIDFALQKRLEKEKISLMEQAEQKKINLLAQQKKQEEDEEKRNLLSNADDLRKFSRYSDNLFFNNPLRHVPGTEAFAARKQLDTQGLLFADKIYTHFNKGTVSDKKMDLIVKKLAPNSELTESENNARINSLIRIMGLPSDASEAEVDKVFKEEQKKLRPPIESFFKGIFE